MKYSVLELAKIVDAEIVGKPDACITQLFYDSRCIIAPQDGVFFAISGIHDGHSFIEEAYAKSIRIFVCRHIPIFHEDAVYLIVKDPLQALQKWAAFHRDQFSFPTIGITGSNGKTIVKEWLYQCIWEEYNIVRSPKSFNSQIGLPVSILQSGEENTLGIFEVGISQPGEMLKQEKMLHPTYGVLTNVLSAHSEYFQNKEEQISEKIKLFRKSPVIIYPAEEKIKAQINSNYSDRKLISFGLKNADIELIDSQITSSGRELKIKVFDKLLTLSIAFTDEASVQNILCLVAILNELQFDFKFIKEKFSQLQSVSMRLEIIKGLNNNVIINDSFNSDYKSLEIALNFLSLQNKPKKALILSDILQSHTPVKELYHNISKLVNSFIVDNLFLIGDNIKEYQHLFTAQPQLFSSQQEITEFLDTHPVRDTAILIKGARKFSLEKIASHLEMQTHDTILEVDLHALMTNVNYFKSLLKPETKIIGMVKASSYGLGSFEVAEVLQYYHIDYLAVAYADEGALLREKGIYLPIMVMNPEISSYDSVIDNSLEPEIYSFRVLEKFIRKIKEKSISEKYPIHIKIDTGMHRLGFLPEEVEELALKLKNNPFVEVKSVFSHFAASDMPEQEEDFTRLQAKRLRSSYEIIIDILGYKPLLHISNSPGIINYPEYQFDAVRLGIGMYGYIENDKAFKKLENVATLKTVISNIHILDTGETIGYGRRFKAQRKSSIATLPIGYADGIRRMVGNEKGYVTVSGKKAPIVGTVCMDMLMIDVTAIPCKEGDSVVILGENPGLKEYAEWCETIPYEILTSISPRVKRIYYRE
ncbi:bifunctional UDP-N-acetylmuramoyl-tripeptide:D-alanyl-D-alanine ligase/alanine racemase [Apibacter sp. HY039]|uniref:bifunctional UDP-N-acetylmuramoyl-tripeptide:D-alanyl-D-alanine ligase/alanine racemase n=1 Tax=Apibacter sp. HY039 TaxID=2501476 RepID=UPI000FEC007A|nr:bifunctional UDP-N-acetylmuramoyl-tripeptide:D-alanyl-D-alanine ligase/alanine racemase [Apibacter sp. HY039]